MLNFWLKPYKEKENCAAVRFLGQWSDFQKNKMNKKCKYVICLPMEHQGVHKNSFRIARVFQDRIGISKCWFLRVKHQSTRSRVENQQQTQSTGSGNRARDTMVGGERSHHCAIPAPLNMYFVRKIVFHRSCGN